MRRVWVVVLLFLSGCSVLPDRSPGAAPTEYRLHAEVVERLDSDGPVLLVMPIRAVPGLDSRSILYLNEPHRAQGYRDARWVDTPARQLEPLLVAAAEGSGGFRAVVAGRGAGTGGADVLRLDSDLLALQQEWLDERDQVRIALRVTLSRPASGQVVASHRLAQQVVLDGVGAEAAVTAFNRALPALLETLGDWLVEQINE